MRPQRDDEAIERSRIGNLIVLTWQDVARYLDLPLSTLDALRAEGKGPRAFRVGRRLYVSRTDLLAWLTKMAQEEA